MSASGSLKAIDAPRAFAAESASLIEAAARSVVEEAIAHGERGLRGVEGYLPRTIAARAADKLRGLFLRSWKDGFGRGREDR